MKSCAFRGFWGFAAAAVLAACETATQQPITLLSGPGYSEFIGTRMVAANDGTLPPAGLMAFDNLLADGNASDLRDAIRRMGPHGPQTNDQNLINEVRQGGGGHGFEARGLTGVGGIAGHALLDAATLRLGTGLDLSPQWTTETESWGKITDYEYDNATGDGRLAVTVKIVTTATHNNRSVPPKENSKIYKFEINVDGGFAVRAKTPQNASHYDENDVFPNTGIKINADMAADFDFKLYASGTSIKIARVWVDRDGDGPQDFEEIKSNSTGWKSSHTNLLEESPANCIDMMFAFFGTSAPFIPTTYEELVSTGGPPQYCLGRCANPPLINTK